MGILNFLHLNARTYHHWDGKPERTHYFQALLTQIDTELEKGIEMKIDDDLASYESPLAPRDLNPQMGYWSVWSGARGARVPLHDWGV